MTGSGKWNEAAKDKQLCSLFEFAAGHITVAGTSPWLWTSAYWACLIFQIVAASAVNGCGSLFNDPCALVPINATQAESTQIHCIEVKHAADDDSFSLMVLSGFVFTYFVFETARDCLDCFQTWATHPTGAMFSDICLLTSAFGWVVMVILLLVANCRILASGQTVDNFLKNFLCTVLIMQLDDVVKNYINSLGQPFSKWESTILIAEHRSGVTGKGEAGIECASVLVLMIGAVGPFICMIVFAVNAKHHASYEPLPNGFLFKR